MSSPQAKLGALLALTLAVAAASSLWQYRTNVRLATTVQTQAAENHRLRTANTALSAALAARDRIAAVSSEPKSDSGEPAAPARLSKAISPAGLAASSPLAAGLAPVDTLGNTGRTTPRAAWATQLWAARTGDIDLEASTLAFDPATRAQLLALADTLPAELRATYDTPEKLMAFVLAGSPHPVGGMQILSETTNAPGEVTLHTQWQHTDDTIVHQSEVHLQQSADGWKWVVPSALVHRAVVYLTRTVRPSTGEGKN